MFFEKTHKSHYIMEPGGAPEDADAAYPETEGYDEFVSSHNSALEKLASLRSDLDTESHLRTNIKLLEESGHLMRWFALKNSEDPALMTASAAREELRLQARQAFLVDAACDAANHHYQMKHGTGFATSSADLQASAQQGINMLFRALQLPGDPMQVRRKLSEKVDDHLILLKKRIIKLRVEEEKERRRKLQQKLAEAKAAAAAEAKRKKNSQCRSMFAIVLGLVLAAAWVQSMQHSL